MATGMLSLSNWGLKKDPELKDRRERERERRWGGGRMGKKEGGKEGKR